MAKIPYFSIEMVIGNQKPVLASPTLRVYSNSNLFYKEALWNRLEKEIPEYYNKIIFLDSDIIFEKTNWVDELSIILNTHDLVHIFENATLLDIYFKPIERLTSSIKELNIYGAGYGWAINRSTFLKINGFLDTRILGGGDSAFIHSILGTNNIFLGNTVNNNKVHKYLQDSYTKYKNNMQSLKLSYTHFSCNIYHLYHGSRINRNYDNRYSLLNSLDNEWNTLFIENKDGFLELIDNTINLQLYLYFKNRKEDDSIPIVKPVPLTITATPAAPIKTPTATPAAAPIKTPTATPAPTATAPTPTAPTPTAPIKPSTTAAPTATPAPAPAHLPAPIQNSTQVVIPPNRPVSEFRQITTIVIKELQLCLKRIEDAINNIS
jgi:hypothetical protein